METLRRIRTMRGMNQIELAKASGVAQNTISEIEIGKRQARPATLKKLADALGVEIADFFEEGEAPKVGSPPPPQRSLWNHLADEQRADATIRESEHLKDRIRGNLERWRQVACGEDPNLAPNHAYAIEIYQHIIDLTDWCGELLRALKAELPAEAAISEQHEIIGLIDQMGAVAAEIRAIADAAEGLTRGAVDEEAQALIDAEVQGIVAQQRPADQIAQLRAEHSRRHYETLNEVQQHAAEAKRLAAGE